jgi:cytochrome P450 family 110
MPQSSPPSVSRPTVSNFPAAPPLVSDHPLVQLWKWSFKPIEFLEECQRRYGDCFQVRLGFVKPSVFFGHPDAIAQLFSSANNGLFDSGRAQPFLKMVLGENSTILLDGKEHRRHRQLLLPPMHGERMRTYGDIIWQITQEHTQFWRPGQVMSIEKVLGDITFQVILNTIFGFKGTQCEKELTKRIRGFLDSFNSPLLYFLVACLPILQKDLGKWSPGGQYLEQIRELDRLMFQAIAEHREHLNPDDIDVLTMLMLARDENGEAMSDIELRDEMLSLLFAGQGTSSVVTSWAFYYVHANPEVKSRLLEELDSLGPNPSPSEISKLPYLNAVCSESMRMRSSVPSSTPRIANEPVEIYGYEFPAESLLVPAQHLTHHRPDLYPDPYRFNPDRFLERRYSNSEFYPYGGGTRYCVGAAFALYQMKLILANILSQYQLELTGRIPVKTVRQGVNIAAEGGVKMLMAEYRQPSKISMAAGSR